MVRKLYAPPGALGKTSKLSPIAPQPGYGLDGAPTKNPDWNWRAGVQKPSQMGTGVFGNKKTGRTRPMKQQMGDAVRRKMRPKASAWDEPGTPGKVPMDPKKRKGGGFGKGAPKSKQKLAPRQPGEWG
jgi:hypothetical protein